jgi:hypothetical protein
LAIEEMVMQTSAPEFWARLRLLPLIVNRWVAVSPAAGTPPHASRKRKPASARGSVRQPPSFDPGMEADRVVPVVVAWLVFYLIAVIGSLTGAKPATVTPMIVAGSDSTGSNSR